MSEIAIHTIEHQLSDGSLAYDVRFGSLILPAVTERDAHHLVDKLARALEEHTNIDVQVSVGALWS